MSPLELAAACRRAEKTAVRGDVGAAMRALAVELEGTESPGSCSICAGPMGPSLATCSETRCAWAATRGGADAPRVGDRYVEGLRGELTIIAYDPLAFNGDGGWDNKDWPGSHGETRCFSASNFQRMHLERIPPGSPSRLKHHGAEHMPESVTPCEACAHDASIELDRRRAGPPLTAEEHAVPPPLRPGPDYQGFQECASCAAKSGSPQLCASCLQNRTTISGLDKQLRELRQAAVHAIVGAGAIHTAVRRVVATAARITGGRITCSGSDPLPRPLACPHDHPIWELIRRLGLLVDPDDAGQAAARCANCGGSHPTEDCRSTQPIEDIDRVPRGHCSRCDKCHLPMDHLANTSYRGWVCKGQCGMPPRKTCACGAPYAEPAAPVQDAEARPELRPWDAQREALLLVAVVQCEPIYRERIVSFLLRAHAAGRSALASDVDEIEALLRDYRHALLRGDRGRALPGSLDVASALARIENLLKIGREVRHDAREASR